VGRITAGEVTYRHLARDMDRHGNERLYLRLAGKPKVRLHCTPGTPEFDVEYRQAIKGGPVKPAPLGDVIPRSLKAFCIAYYGSAECKRLDARTRHVRRLILDKVVTEHGHRPGRKMRPQDVLAIRDAKAERPEAANSIVKALRAVFGAAIARGLCEANPAEKVSYLQSGSPGFHSWTPEEVRAFEAHHSLGSTAQLALALLLYTGQRRSDVVRFGPGMVRDGWLHFTQFKGRGRKPITLALPIVADLQGAIAVSKCGADTFLITEFGKPFTANGFGNRFRKWCDDAGLSHCSAHGLRKAAATRLAEMGCSAHEIMAITGHTTLKEVARYTAAVSQKTMAARAMARFANPPIASGVSHSTAPTAERDDIGDQILDAKGLSRCVVPRDGVEPPTLRFSVACSTN